MTLQDLHERDGWAVDVETDVGGVSVAFYYELTVAGPMKRSVRAEIAGPTNDGWVVSIRVDDEWTWYQETFRDLKIAMATVEAA